MWINFIVWWPDQLNDARIELMVWWLTCWCRDWFACVRTRLIVPGLIWWCKDWLDAVINAVPGKWNIIEGWLTVLCVCFHVQSLLKPDVWQRVPGLEELMTQFLAPGLWEKHKSEFSRKVCRMCTFPFWNHHQGCVTQLLQMVLNLKPNM